VRWLEPKLSSVPSNGASAATRGQWLSGSRRLLSGLADDRLVDQIRQGDEAAFEVVYDRHHRRILAFCRHMLGSAHAAEDAVQQVFASAFASLTAGSSEMKLQPWLYAIARNRCVTMLRANREQPAVLEDIETVGLAEEVERRADLRELLQDLHKLSEDQREALVLYELGDLPQPEIARVLEVEPNKVRSLVFQARSALIRIREARAIPCAEIRDRLATGGALRGGPLWRHLVACEGCSHYRDEVRARRN
jgi:RNA polymerase sigma factor (sigma-70 family)